SIFRCASLLGRPLSILVSALSLHDALPIYGCRPHLGRPGIWHCRPSCYPAASPVADCRLGSVGLHSLPPEHLRGADGGPESERREVDYRRACHRRHAAAVAAGPDAQRRREERSQCLRSIAFPRPSSPVQPTNAKHLSMSPCI